MPFKEIALIILILAAAVFFVILAIFVFKLMETVKKVNRAIDDNRRDIERTIAEIPLIMRNVNGISGTANQLIANVSPDIENVVHKVDTTMTVVGDTTTHITRAVNDVTDNVRGTVHYLTTSVNDTASDIKYNLASATDYIGFIYDIIDIVKGVLRK